MRVDVTRDLTIRSREATGSASYALPVIVVAAGPGAGEQLVEFFAATIRNRNTRDAYVRAVG